MAVVKKPFLAWIPARRPAKDDTGLERARRTGQYSAYVDRQPPSTMASNRLFLGGGGVHHDSAKSVPMAASFRPIVGERCRPTLWGRLRPSPDLWSKFVAVAAKSDPYRPKLAHGAWFDRTTSDAGSLGGTLSTTARPMGRGGGLAGFLLHAHLPGNRRVPRVRAWRAMGRRGGRDRQVRRASPGCMHANRRPNPRSPPMSMATEGGSE